MATGRSLGVIEDMALDQGEGCHRWQDIRFQRRQDMENMPSTFHAAIFSNSNDVEIGRSDIVIKLDEIVEKASDPGARTRR